MFPRRDPKLSTPDPRTGESAPARPRVWRRRLAVAVSALAWTYFGAIVIAWLVLRLAGDRWWVATLVLFGPRWVFAVPLALLAPAAAVLRRKALAPLVVAALIVAVPIMGFCLPWARLLHRKSSGPRLRVLTCNIHHRLLDAPALASFIAQTRPDVVV